MLEKKLELRWSEDKLVRKVDMGLGDELNILRDLFLHYLPFN